MKTFSQAFNWQTASVIISLLLSQRYY